MVLNKIENAFAPGDPVLHIAAVGGHQHSKPQVEESKHREHWVQREEQALLDGIVAGEIRGQYHLLVGEKGTGKSSMLLDAMAKLDGEGCAMFDAHSDPEIFRVRLGKALDFEYHEDNIGALFSIRGPRDANALLDVERAFNKLEKVALKRRATSGKPLILIMNAMHLLRDDGEGRDLLELLQQRAEQWAASNLVTIIFNSDDYWIYERLKQYATRMNVIRILDLSKRRSLAALRTYRIKHKGEDPEPSILEQVYDKVGGRLAFLGKVAKADDMLKTADEICEIEKTWFLNQCWILGMTMDDDVMENQKYASAACVLAKALVDQEKGMESTYDPEEGHILPEIALHKARQVMTRADFIKVCDPSFRLRMQYIANYSKYQSYDAINVFTIDSKAQVRADSVPMMNAFRQICGEDGFDELLEATLERIGDIESLGRTREITIKDLWNNGKYNVQMRDAQGKPAGSLTFHVKSEDDEDNAKKD
jgi:hypothetical protein